MYPVQLVNVPLVGVPNNGVINVGLVAYTIAPVPVPDTVAAGVPCTFQLVVADI